MSSDVAHGTCDMTHSGMRWFGREYCVNVGEKRSLGKQIGSVMLSGKNGEKLRNVGAKTSVVNCCLQCR